VKRKAACALLALLGGCEVGTPLVGDTSATPSMREKPKDPCLQPRICDGDDGRANTLLSARPLTWAACGSDCDSGTGSFEFDGDDGGVDPADEQMPIDCRPPASFDQLERSHISCTTLRLLASATVPPPASGATLTFSGAVWTSSNIAIEADEPLEVVIASSQLIETRFHLSGPVSMRFQDGTVMKQVGVSGDSEQARVFIDHLSVEELTLGDSATPFAGHFEARHSQLVGASVYADSIALDSSRLTASFLAAESLTSGDSTLTDVVIGAGDATFAPSTLEVVDFARCRSLTFFASTLSFARVPRCEGEATRLYNSTLSGGTLDGDVVAESTPLTNVLLGRDEPSDFVFWNVPLVRVNFCDHVESTKLLSPSILCSTCAERAFDEPEALCFLTAPGQPPPNKEDGLDNFCAALEEIETCASPYPERLRPSDPP